MRDDQVHDTPNNPAGRGNSADDGEEWARGAAMARKMARELAGGTGYSDDVAAEAMVGLAEAAARFDRRVGARLTTFAHARMRGRAVRAAVTEARARRTVVAMPDETVQEQERRMLPAEVSEQLRATIEARRLLERAGSLPKDDRYILRAHFLEGQPIAAIARRKGWSHSSASRARDLMLCRLRASVAQ